MSITTALKWRYASKRMNGEKIPQNKLDSILDAIALAPSSFGLQPYTIFIIEDKAMLEKIKPIAMMQPQITEASALLVFAAWDQLTQERIDIYLAQMASERGVSEASLKALRDPIEAQLKHSEVDNFNWNAKQAYIALGFGLAAAAVDEIDSTPMEGFDKAALDELLALKATGLKSCVLLTLGYRDVKNDYLINLKKIRREKSKLFIHFPV
jgi:nitroreductase / dihydropteridine reductase